MLQLELVIISITDAATWTIIHYSTSLLGQYQLSMIKNDDIIKLLKNMV